MSIQTNPLTGSWRNTPFVDYDPNREKRQTPEEKVLENKRLTNVRRAVEEHQHRNYDELKDLGW